MKQKKKTLSSTKEQQLESKVRKLQKENRELKKELQRMEKQALDHLDTLADEAKADENLEAAQNAAPADDEPDEPAA